jgi:hypothetical protein
MARLVLKEIRLTPLDAIRSAIKDVALEIGLSTRTASFVWRGQVPQMCFLHSRTQSQTIAIVFTQTTAPVERGKTLVHPRCVSRTPSGRTE